MCACTRAGSIDHEVRAESDGGTHSTATNSHHYDALNEDGDDGTAQHSDVFALVPQHADTQYLPNTYKYVCI